MFEWDKKRTRLDVSARRVLRLERSLSDVQVSMPGMDPQSATAYLCVFQASQGLRIAFVLHLHQAESLAFYLNNDGDLDKDEASRVLGEAVNFAETLGFMLGNLDFHRLSPESRQSFWDALPLQQGLAPAKATTAKAAPTTIRKPFPAAPVVECPTRGWTVEEMVAKRRRFVENLGRLMAML